MLFLDRLRLIVVLNILGLMVACTGNRDGEEKSDHVLTDNADLEALYEQDQADRSSDSLDFDVISPRDSVRRARVLELLDSAVLNTSEDYRHAAMIFQHGPDTAAARLAHELAKKAVAIDSTNTAAKWLMAASWDRYQMRLGKPQWYGTQYVGDPQGTGWRLYDIDTTAVSDEDRRRLGVPSLSEARARAEGSRR